MRRTSTTAPPIHAPSDNGIAGGVAKTDSQDFKPSESRSVKGPAEEAKTYASKEKITIVPFRVRNGDLTLQEFEIF